MTARKFTYLDIGEVIDAETDETVLILPAPDDEFGEFLEKTLNGYAVTEEAAESDELSTLRAQLSEMRIERDRAVEWFPMSEAPKDATEILAEVKQNKSGYTSYMVIHWAHGGGDDQPPFGPAWFYNTGGYGYAELSAITPTRWRWIELRSRESTSQDSGT